MRDLLIDMDAAGGAATRKGLIQLGHTHRSLRAAVHAGLVREVGRSWLVLPAVNPSVVRALEQGGVLGGASALRSFGIWVTAATPTQIATPPHKGVRAAVHGTRIWEPFELDARPWRVSVVHALAQHASRVPRVEAIASIDSALHLGLVTEADLDRLFELLPQRCSGWRDDLDARAESGLETHVRVPCRDRGWRVRSQVPAPGGGRSDLLIEDWLYIETDGDRWHDHVGQAGRDRRRNAAITDAGGRWLRFGHADVLDRFERTMATIELVLAQGRPSRRIGA